MRVVGHACTAPLASSGPLLMPVPSNRLRQALVSVSTIGTCDDQDDGALALTVKSELSEWFGKQETEAWELLRIYRIPFAQPNQARPAGPLSHLGGVSSSLPRITAPHPKPYPLEPCGSSHSLRPQLPRRCALSQSRSPA